MNATKILCPLSDAALKFADQPAIIFSARAITYSQLEAHVCSTVKHLKKIGVQPGDKVAIVSFNSIEYVIVLLALWRMGAVACLLSTRLPAQNLCNQISNLNASFLLSSSHKILSIGKITAKKFTLEDMINFDIRDSSFSKPSSIDLDQDATLMFTSGTSHEPKAVLHTYGNHYFNALGSNENIPLVPGDRWLLALALYHVGGLGILFRTILSGAAVVIPNQEEDLSANKITHISLVTTQLYRILQDKNSLKNFSSLKAVLVGASAVPSALLTEALETNLPVYLTYGLTEMASQVTTSTKVLVRHSEEQSDEESHREEILRFAQNDGRMLFHNSLKILNYRQLKISEDGEICVKGKTLFKGYFKNGKVSLPLTDDGWFKTGDLGKMDGDGNLLVSGRKDNMFISGGENIQPEEIEQCLYDLEDIKKAIVIGVENEEFGFRPAAFLKIREGAKVSIDVLVKFLEEKLARFKIPVAFYEWPHLSFPNVSRGDNSNSKEIRREFIQLIKEKPAGLKQIF